MASHLSLFSGIGGLDLAAEWAGFETVGQCEFADYPTKILEKHWPDVPRWRDIRTLTKESFYERTGRRTAAIVSGGFPCQPHSSNGKRKASSDERDLWPEFRRVVSEIAPDWVVAENVRGLLTSDNFRFFGGILRDLADLGYNAGWCCFPASWVGAVHRRERVFIIANSAGRRWGKLDKMQQNGYTGMPTQATAKGAFPACNIPFYVDGTFANPISGILRNDDGIPGALDRLKCLGNAVVPQQAYPIFKAIMEVIIWLSRNQPLPA